MRMCGKKNGSAAKTGGLPLQKDIVYVQSAIMNIQVNFYRLDMGP